ncbi:hypothetical protein ACFX11_040509 [Malus domestica]
MILDELVSRGVVPDSVTYNTMMNGACVDILDCAMILMAKLLKLAFLPNTTTTTTTKPFPTKWGRLKYES